MTLDRARLRWNGWGYADRGAVLSEARGRALVDALAARIGAALVPPPRAAELATAELPESRIEPALAVELDAALGSGGLRMDAAERAMHAGGKSLPDLLHLRAGTLERAPDAVAYPADVGAVARLLALAVERELAVVPFGGGTSVVGGVDPLLPAGKRALIALDTTRLDRLLALDQTSATATFQAGIDGPALEAALAEHGYTLGHFPQSFEHSTLGGWIATRSSGQQSDGYGGIDDMLVSARLVTPRGELSNLAVPRHASGPDLRQVILGSEGTLGVIVEATLRVRKKRKVHAVHGALFRDFSSGLRALRELGGSDLPIGMMRLSDAEETAVSLLLRRDPDRRVDAAAALLGGAEKLGYGAGRCLFLLGIEGDDARLVTGQMVRAQALCVRQGALPLGPSPGRSWKKERFETPYLRDFLFDEGLAIDTMETAFAWSGLELGHARVTEALQAAMREQAGGGIAMAHVSHSYPDGACVYFVAIYPLSRSRALAQWQAIKNAATEAIIAAGGTLSHHHGVGVDHRRWMPREKGELGMDALRAIKQALDPRGVMNPGKLL